MLVDDEGWVGAGLAFWTSGKAVGRVFVSIFTVLEGIVLFVWVFLGIMAGVRIYGRIVLFLEKVRAGRVAGRREVGHVW